MLNEILQQLQGRANPDYVHAMARFGINTESAWGISVTELRKFAKPFRNNHQLALELWASGIHEARILATIIDDPAQLTEVQMDTWVKDFDSWDICDQSSCNLFDKAPFAHVKALEWAQREPEFEKRAGFALIAALAWHRKNEPDEFFLQFLPSIQEQATDPRNFVKKAVSWALREIGNRSAALRPVAIHCAEDLLLLDTTSARWIARDALRELRKK